MNNTNVELIIKTKIWEKENLDLIDYLNEENTKTKIKTNTSGVLCRNQKNIFFNQGENQPESPDDLLRIQRNNENGKFSINCGNYSKDLYKLVDEQGAFLVYTGFSFKDLNNKLYRLFQGDIIKIGRVYFKVLDIHLIRDFDEIESNSNNENSIRGTMIKSFSSNNVMNNYMINGQHIIRGSYSPDARNNKINKFCYSKNDIINNSNSLITSKISNFKRNESLEIFTKKKNRYLPQINTFKELISFDKKKNNINNKIPSKKTKKKNNPICRICYGDESTENDPLISPCICKGSLKYIHYKCLKNWFDSKIEKELLIDSNDNDNDIITYNRKDISCELCKEKLPDYIKHNGKIYNITFYKPNFEQFIVLESMKANKDKIKYIHLISFDNKSEICIGRSNICELSMNELTISRCHCIIHKRYGDLYLEDNNSKYGTLVLVQNNNMIINDLMPLKLQINQTYIKLKINIPFYLKCCGYQETLEPQKYEYQFQNKESLDILSYFIIKEDDLNSNDDNDEEEVNKEEIKSFQSNKSKKTIKSIKSIKSNKSKNIKNSKDNKIKNNINDNISKILIDDDIEIKNKIEKNNEGILNEKENSLIKNRINNFYINPLLNRFKKINIKKDIDNECGLPKLDKINFNNFKDSISSIFDKNKSNLNNYNNIQSKIQKYIQNDSNFDKTSLEQNMIPSSTKDMHGK